MKLAYYTVAACAFGWALVYTAELRNETLSPRPEYELFIQVERPAEQVWETPIADSLVDWVEVDRETECLWVMLQEYGVELTFENVWAAGVWTDALGGACLLIGEDDE
jgi:hypothetical protein